MKNPIEIEKQTLLQTYGRLPIEISTAKGNSIWDKHGVEYKDYLAGIAVNVLGHSHPAVIAAAIAQIERYMHVSNYFFQEVQIEFAAELLAMSGFNKAFLANSGTEAMEGAIKICRLWGHIKEKTEIVSFTGGFHGRTYGSLSLMDKPQYKDKMGPFLDNIKLVEYNNSQQLEEIVSDRTAAIVLEHIQGEGGVVPATDEFVDTINRLQRNYELLIVADEVQTGLGRTGKFFAFQHWNCLPDIVTMAKGIGGGLPLGAILIQEHIADILSVGQHGTTFGGNPVACAAGRAVLNELKLGVIDNSAIVGKYFLEQLQTLQTKFPNIINDVRGKGLIIGIELAIPATKIVSMLLENKHIITNSTNINVIRLLPPLNITKADADYYIDALQDCLFNMR